MWVCSLKEDWILESKDFFVLFCFLLLLLFFFFYDNSRIWGLFENYIFPNSILFSKYLITLLGYSNTILNRSRLIFENNLTLSKAGYSGPIILAHCERMGPYFPLLTTMHFQLHACCIWKIVVLFNNMLCYCYIIVMML